jgi:transcriptional regulator
MIFQGPEAYITPNWYPSKAADGKAVPSWNYAAVHAYGRPAVMNDAAWLLRHVGELTDQQERSAAHPWKVTDAPERYVETMLRGVVGFRFEIARLEGKWKMSQNRDMPDRVGTAEGLEARGRGEDAQVAALVRSAMTPAK